MGQAFTLTAFAVGGSCRGAGLYELERSSAAKETRGLCSHDVADVVKCPESSRSELAEQFEHCLRCAE